MNYNNKKQNFSKNKNLIRKKEGIKPSLSFNNININNPNITYNFENNTNDLFIRRINDFSICTSFQSKQINDNNNERKINFINVNNYFNPQINIIKVNKLNEPKKSFVKNNKNELMIKHYLSNKNGNKSKNIEKVKIIQLWWKEINKVIKIQKHFRGFIFRNKLLEILEKVERTFYYILEFYKIIRKIIITYSFKKIKKYFLNKKLKNNFKSKLINNKKLLKELNDNNSGNKFILNNERFTINKNNKRTNINNYKNFSKIIIKTKKENIPKSFEIINIINNKKEYNKTINDKNKKKEELRIKICKLSRNKNNFNNNLINLINKNKKNNNNIIFENNNYNRKNNKKSIGKSRNRESNNTYFYQNRSKYLNSKILTDNNKFICLTNKNSNINKLKKNKNIGQSTKSKILQKKFFNYNNLIIDNPNTERNKSIKIKELINNKILKKNNLMNNDLSKKYNINNIKNCFLLWKEKTEKKDIIKYLYNNTFSYNHFNNTIYNKNNINKTKKKTLIKIQNLKIILLKKGLGLLIKKILNKCTLYKYFILFNYYTEKINIFQKLKNYLYFKSNFRTHINRTKLVDSINKKDCKYSTILTSNSTKHKKEKIRNKKIDNNNNKLSLSYSYICKNKKKLSFNDKYKNLDNNNPNLKCPKTKINRIIYNNLFKKENNDNNKNNKIFRSNIISYDYKLIMQINQLKMIFNLIELKIKKQKSLMYYFNKWKNNKKYYTTYNFKIKKKYFLEDDISPRERITYPICKYRNHSYSSKDNKIYTKIKFKKYNDYNNGIKLNTIRNDIIRNNFVNNNNNINDSINMIYKKKYARFGSKATRIKISNEYSSLL